MPDIDKEESRLRPETIEASLSIIKTGIETDDARFRTKIHDFEKRTETNRGVDYYYATFDATNGPRDYKCEICIQQDADGALVFGAAVNRIKPDRSTTRVLTATIEDASLKLGSDILAKIVAKTTTLDT